MLVWKVHGWDGTNNIYESEFRFGSFTEKQMGEFLRRLACRHLNPDEIAECTRTRRKGEDCGLLQVSRDVSNGRLTLSVGASPYYTATVRLE